MQKQKKKNPYQLIGCGCTERENYIGNEMKHLNVHLTFEYSFPNFLLIVRS